MSDLEKRLKLLYIGYGDAGQNILKGSLEALDAANREADIYVIHGKDTKRHAIERKFSMDGYTRNKQTIISMSREYIDDVLDKGINFDQIIVSIGNKIFDKDKKIIHTEFTDQIRECLTIADIDTSFNPNPKGKQTNPDYRFMQQLPPNWELITKLANKFKEKEVKGLVDIYTNQSDVFTYLWSSITGNVRTVFGNNHLDTHRLRRTWSTAYNNFRIKHGMKTLILPELDAVCAGYHGGGCVPLLFNSTVNGFEINQGLSDFDNPEFYKDLKEMIINHASDMIESNMNIRSEVDQAYKDILNTMIHKEKPIGMSIFQKITENPCIVGSESLKDFDDHGVYMGYGTKIIDSSIGKIWEPVHPDQNKMFVTEQNDFVTNYLKIHKLIDALHKSGLIENLVDFNKDEERSIVMDERRNDFPIEISNNSDAREKVLLYSLNKDDRSVINEINITDSRNERRFVTKTDTPKITSRVGLRCIAQYDNLLVAEGIHDYKVEPQSYIFLWNLLDKTEGIKVPIRTTKAVDDNGNPVSLFMMNHEASDTVSKLNNNLYFIIDNLKIDRPSPNVFVYNLKTGQTSTTCFGDYKEELGSTASLNDVVLFGGENTIFYKQKNRLKKLAKTKCEVYNLKTIPNENIILYSNDDVGYVFSFTNPNMHKEIDLKGNFDIAKNGNIILGQDNGKIIRYNSIEDLFENNGDVHELPQSDRILVPSTEAIVSLDLNDNKMDVSVYNSCFEKQFGKEGLNNILHLSEVIR